MKTPGQKTNGVHLPADELVSDAERRTLQQQEQKQHTNNALRKNLAQLLMESPIAGANLNLERRKDHPRSVEL